jgi:hypothetical protein
MVVKFLKCSSRGCECKQIICTIGCNGMAMIVVDVQLVVKNNVGAGERTNGSQAPGELFF